MKYCDFLVIGGGIAGTSAAFELAHYGKVVLLEAEANLGLHSTGRSAAISSTGFETTTVRHLGAVSREFFIAPPPNFTEVPLCSPLHILWLARKGQEDKFAHMKRDALKEEHEVTLLSPYEAVDSCPIINESSIIGALLEHGALTLDVNAIHQGYIKGIKKLGGEIVTNARTEKITNLNGSWEITVRGETYTTPIVINAAGAWCDEVAKQAGLSPIGMKVLRRSIFTIEGPSTLLEYPELPFVYDVEEKIYFKFENRNILISPSEEVECRPGQTHTDHYDIAIAADLFQQLTTLTISRIQNQWAGSRNFAPDRELVIGEDPQARGFFWLAGQGGIGIMTAPAVAQYLGDLVVASSNGTNNAPFLPESVSPARFR